MILLINLTPHTVHIEVDGGKVCTFPPSHPPARVAVTHRPGPSLGPIPTVTTHFGEVEGLPPPQDGVYYIVSQFVLQACPDRDDLLRPDTGPDAVRDAAGRIVAVRRLTR